MKKRILVLIMGLLLCGIGTAAWGYQIINGLAVTNLSNSFSWGLYMGTFEFFISVSSGGMIFFSIAYLFKKEQLMPFTKIAAVSSMGSVMAAGVIIMVDLGQPFRAMQMILTPNIQSPLFWDVVILGMYAAVCFAAVVIQVLPDTKKKRHSRNAKIDCSNHSRLLSFIALPMVIMVNAVTTLMFAVQNARVWWHSALLPVDSIAVATSVGLSFMILVCMLAVGNEKFSRFKEAFALPAKIAAYGLLAHFFFTILELAPFMWNNTVEGKELLELLFGTYGALYAAELILPLMAMLLYFTKSGRGNKITLAAANIFVIISGFIHRMMMLLPAFNMFPLSFPVAGAEGAMWTYPIASGIMEPGQKIFVSFWNYNPTIIEWCANLLPFGLTIVFVAGILVLSPLFPVDAPTKDISIAG